MDPQKKKFIFLTRTGEQAWPSLKAIHSNPCSTRSGGRAHPSLEQLYCSPIALILEGVCMSHKESHSTPGISGPYEAETQTDLGTKALHRQTTTHS